MAKQYRVYINQINQTFVNVEAKDQTSAIAKALKQWKKENEPSVMSVAVLNNG